MILLHTHLVFPVRVGQKHRALTQPPLSVKKKKKSFPHVGKDWAVEMSLFLIHLLRAPHKTELFLISQRAEEVPALTQFIKVLMEDNYEVSCSESDCVLQALG